MKIRVAAIAAILVLVCIPRFQMWDPGPVGRLAAGAKDFPWGHPIDVEGYERLVHYFRGQAPADSMISPFCFRPLAPAVAAVLPASPGVAINLFDLACLLACALLLERIGARVGLGGRGRWAAGLMFALSFPAFYYGTIGFIDPAAILFAALMLLLVLRGSGPALLVPAMVLAVLAKETNAAFALLPLATLFHGEGKAWGALGMAALLLAVAAGTHLIVRLAAPFPGHELFWSPSLSAAVENLSRPRTFLSLLLTIGIPTGFAALAAFTGKARRVISSREASVLATGVLLSIALYAYSIVSAYTDGRIIWASYPFLIPLAATWFDRP